MDKEEFQKKYDNSILVCCTEDKIKKVFNICDLMDLTASNSKQATAILIGEQTAKSPLFHVEQFLNDFYNEIEGREEKQLKEPTFNKGNKNNVHHQGRKWQHIPSKQIVEKSVRIKGAQDPIHNGRGRNSGRDIQGEIKEEIPSTIPYRPYFIINPLYICYNGNEECQGGKTMIRRTGKGTRTAP